MDRKHMSGVLGLLSSQVASRFRITPSAYLSPMVSAMYLRAWCRVRSGHQDLCSISIKKGISQSINQSINQSVCQLLNKTHNQSIIQSARALYQPYRTLSGKIRGDHISQYEILRYNTYFPYGLGFPCK